MLSQILQLTSTIFLIFQTLPVLCNNPLVVNTPSGPIEGFTLTTYTGKEISAFFGVPYAKPPLGNLRFQKPVPIEPWTETLEAKTLPPICPQKWVGAWHESEKPADEDCLYLTISVPKSSSAQKLPVMVRFHGGGFVFGGISLEWSNTTTLAAEENVIVVSVGYRLGVLGFLYLDTSSAPGNVGLWDQNLALKWVKENIEAFGGDPDSITLFGESAGGASGNYHLLSAHSHPYFNRAILDSGVSTNPWAFMEPSEAFKLGLKLAKNVNCEKSCSKKMVECLQKVPWKNLIQETLKLSPDTPASFLFVPTLDKKKDFIPDFPRNLIKNGKFKKTEILTGVTANEGIMFAISYIHKRTFPDQAVDKLTDDDFQKIVKIYVPSENKNNKKLTKDVITHFYRNWTDPDSQRNVVYSIDDLLGDVLFTCDLNEFADKASKSGSRVFKYVFDSPRNSFQSSSKYQFTLHAEQSLNVYGYFLKSELNPDAERIEISKRMMKMWADFARTGNPNSESDNIWPEYTTLNKEYLLISNTGNDIRYGYRDNQCALWTELLPKLAENDNDCHNIRDSNLNNKKQKEEL